MITPELISYIRAQLSLGKPRDQIRLELMQGGGWKQSDIDEVFTTLGVGSTTMMPSAPIAVPKKRGGLIFLIICIVLLGGVFAFAQHYQIQSLNDVKKVLGIESTETSMLPPACAPGMMYDVTNAVCVETPVPQTQDDPFMPQAEPEMPVDVKTAVSITPEFASFRVKAGGVYKDNIYVPAAVYITAAYSDGSTLVISDMTSATYTISDPAIAVVEEITVQRDGVMQKAVDLKGIKAGKTTLTITYQGLTKSLPVQVLAGSTSSRTSASTTATKPATTTTSSTSTSRPAATFPPASMTTQSSTTTTSSERVCPNFHYYDSVADTCQPY